MIRRLLIAFVVFLVVVVVAADRVGAIVAAHVLAGKVQSDEHLPTRPDVSIGGFPFLTQAAHGTYKSVTIKAADFPVGGLSVSSLTAHLYGVHIPLSHAIHRTVSQVPVDRVSGTAFVSFANINSYLAGNTPIGRRVTVQAGRNGKAVVLDRVRAGGRTITMRGVGTLALSGNEIDVSVTKLVGVPGSSATAAVLGRALKSLSIALPLHALPFRIALSSVSISAAGVSVVGSARNVVLGSRGA